MIHYSELFRSQQGEARYTGVPSVFLRTFGCNFRCRNFNRTGDTVITDGSPNPEVKYVIDHIFEYNSLEDLPLVQSGCDSYPSVYPEFKRFVEKDEVDTLANKIVDLLPNRQWGDDHFVITGGEPLLGWQREYIQLLDHPLFQPLKELTFETNGTQLLLNSLKSYLIDWRSVNGRTYDRGVTFSVSPKLSNSGEDYNKRILPEVIMEYQAVGFTYLKFVVGTEDDVNEAIEATKLYRDAGFTGPVYLMPIGGVQCVFKLNNKRVADLALQHGLRYSDRLHLSLYGNAWAT